ncbi:MAG: acyl-CoA synthetase FdrA [Chloroflexota bacterium]
MPVQTLIKTSEYHDSVSLMLVARELARLPGVSDAAVVMATEANKAILKDANLLTPAAQAATPNDLVIAVSGSDAHECQQALAEAEKLLQKKHPETAESGFRPKTLRAAATSSGANLAVISVAGRYAAEEAWDALRLGLHVLLFSDNVSLEDEIALKQYASQNGLLLMGPGAGTAILNGVALGFANRLPPGPVGIVSAAGTGLQEVSTLLARHGVGLTQGLGTGGRDLKEQVGGLMMLSGLQALQADPATQVIVLVSKPPAAAVAQKVWQQVARSDKPTVVCLLGGDSAQMPHTLTNAPNAAHAHEYARTLEEAAWLGARAAGADLPEYSAWLAQQAGALAGQAAQLRSGLAPGQRCLRALFSGGTLCYEAQVIWREMLSEAVLSNAPLEAKNQMLDSTHSQGHTAVDLGEEEFTVGRPHPMIDNDLRIRRLLQEGRDPATALILLDVVLGYGAHPDPAAELAPAVRQARQAAREAGRELLCLASLTGTSEDPQGLERQAQALQAAGVVLCESNAAAARLAARIIQA